MSIKASNKKFHVLGDIAAVIADISLDDTYSSGGLSFDSKERLE